MRSARRLPSYFADPLGGLPAAQWDELAAGRFYSSALWLRLCALEPGGRCGGVHTELPGGGRAAVPVAAVAGAQNPNCRWHDLLARRGLPSPPPSGILVGQLRGYLAHLLATPRAEPAMAAAELLTAVRSVRMPGDGAPGAQVAMYLTTPDVLALRAAGVQAMPVALAADAWIEIPPGGFPAWLESLGSRHRLRRIRSEVRAFERAGYRVGHHLLSEVYQEVARLTARTEQRYGRAADVGQFTEAFRRHAEVAGSAAEVLLCSAGDGPAVGCLLYYRDFDTVYLRGAGFDYDRLRGAAEYFNLTYYIPARFPGVRWLHAGMSTPDAKALRGARLRPLWLLDLSPGSALRGRDDEVLAHNCALVSRLAESAPAVAGALDSELWRPFCAAPPRAARPQPGTGLL